MINGLAERLRDLRQKNGLSQKDTAKLLEVSPSIISGYETGERTPSVENLLALSRIYRCSTDYLLGKETATLSVTLDVGYICLYFLISPKILTMSFLISLYTLMKCILALSGFLFS